MKSSVLFSSCHSSQTSQELIKGIIDMELPVCTTIVDGIQAFDWEFETKYYTCTVRLCTTDKRTIGEQEFADSVECFGLQFSPDSIDSWSLVKSWLPFIEQLDPSMKLLICNYCGNNKVVTRSKVLNWCIENEFELIEMSPETEEGDSEDELDSYGVKRIRQVLHAHTWPDLIMKDKPDTLSPYMKQLMEETKEDIGKSASSISESEKSTTNRVELPSLDQQEMMQAFHDEGEDGLQSFEKLFSKMQLMKEKADALPPEDRKAFAGQVAMSFLSALGVSDEDCDSD